MNESRYNQRLEFCKAAAAGGYTPRQYLEIQKKADGWASTIIDNAVEGIGKLTKGGIGVSLGAGGLLGLTGAYGYNALKNEFPSKFAPTGSDVGPLKEEKMRQLIARYRSAAEDVRQQNILFEDSENPEDSDMTRYGDFGGFDD